MSQNSDFIREVVRYKVYYMIRHWNHQLLVSKDIMCKQCDRKKSKITSRFSNYIDLFHKKDNIDFCENCLSSCDITIDDMMTYINVVKIIIVNKSYNETFNMFYDNMYEKNKIDNPDFVNDIYKFVYIMILFDNITLENALLYKIFQDYPDIDLLSEFINNNMVFDRISDLLFKVIMRYYKNYNGNILPLLTNISSTVSYKCYDYSLLTYLLLNDDPLTYGEMSIDKDVRYVLFQAVFNVTLLFTIDNHVIKDELLKFSNLHLDQVVKQSITYRSFDQCLHYILANKINISKNAIKLIINEISSIFSTDQDFYRNIIIKMYDTGLLKFHKINRRYPNYINKYFILFPELMTKEIDKLKTNDMSIFIHTCFKLHYAQGDQVLTIMKQIKKKDGHITLSNEDLITLVGFIIHINNPDEFLEVLDSIHTNQIDDITFDDEEIKSINKISPYTKDYRISPFIYNFISYFMSNDENRRNISNSIIKYMKKWYKYGEVIKLVHPYFDNHELFNDDNYNIYLPIIHYYTSKAKSARK